MTSPAAPAVGAGTVVDGVDVAAVEAAVTACAGVSALVPGRFGDTVTYLPGRRVAGIAVDDHEVRVQVRVRWGVPVADVLAQISAVTAGVRHGRALAVVVADVDDPPAPAVGTAGGPPALTAAALPAPTDRSEHP